LRDGKQNPGQAKLGKSSARQHKNPEQWKHKRSSLLSGRQLLAIFQKVFPRIRGVIRIFRHRGRPSSFTDEPLIVALAMVDNLSESQCLMLGISPLSLERLSPRLARMVLSMTLPFESSAKPDVIPIYVWSSNRHRGRLDALHLADFGHELLRGSCSNR
jgi:hypothetical protein